MGLGMTPEWKNPDWRSWGGRGLTDEAIHGGVPRAGRSGGEGPDGLSGLEFEGSQRCTDARWSSRGRRSGRGVARGGSTRWSRVWWSALA
jgi:hypothetical protein